MKRTCDACFLAHPTPGTQGDDTPKQGERTPENIGTTPGSKIRRSQDRGEVTDHRAGQVEIIQNQGQEGRQDETERQFEMKNGKNTTVILGT